MLPRFFFLLLWVSLPSVLFAQSSNRVADFVAANIEVLSLEVESIKSSIDVLNTQSSAEKRANDLFSNINFHEVDEILKSHGFSSQSFIIFQSRNESVINDWLNQNNTFLTQINQLESEKEVLTSQLDLLMREKLTGR